MAPAVGIEPTTRVSYLVIKCHKVSYLYGYDGNKVSYLSCQQFVSKHEMQFEICQQILGSDSTGWDRKNNQSVI